MVETNIENKWSVHELIDYPSGTVQQKPGSRSCFAGMSPWDKTNGTGKQSLRKFTRLSCRGKTSCVIWLMPLVTCRLLSIFDLSCTDAVPEGYPGGGVDSFNQLKSTFARDKPPAPPPAPVLRCLLPSVKNPPTVRGRTTSLPCIEPRFHLGTGRNLLWWAKEMLLLRAKIVQEDSKMKDGISWHHQSKLPPSSGNPSIHFSIMVIN